MSISPSPVSACEDETTLFRKSWTLYDAITAENYMFHREIYALIAEVLRQRHAAGPYAVLDLGCGNARFMAPCFESAPPARYEGVDLSATALEEARAYLRGLEKVTLHHTDMLQAVRASDAAFDVIFTGFAVHHLDAAEKQELFHACAARLAPGGVFLMVDVVREEGQNREDYLHGYLGTMRTHWTAVHPEQLDEACAHVAAFDFPEMLSDLTHMAANAGLAQTRLLQRHAQHHILQFSV
ncbi:MAG: class I SAM-dependent methyltransferase [Prosthecobacter sp.]